MLQTYIYPTIKFLLTGFLFFILSACTLSNQQITTYPSSNKNNQLVYVGQNPLNQEQSLVRVRDVTLAVFNSVPQPSLDSLHLLNHTRIDPGETVLDMGTGTGVQAIFAANNASSVIAIDINPAATKNARFNVDAAALQNKIDIRTGDLFEPLSNDEQFDVIILNLKYPQDHTNHALWRAHERFFDGVKNHLKPDGRIYYQFGYIRNQTNVEKMLANNQLYISDRKLGRSPSEGNGLFISVEIRRLPHSSQLNQ